MVYGRYIRMENVNNDKKDEILKRLNRIEGQIKGIQRMLENDKSCVDILTQVAAVRAAINKVGGMVLENYSVKCLKNAATTSEKENVMQELTKTIQSFLKFVD
jgi:Uncharacterized protein conserved in bacteria